MFTWFFCEEHRTQVPSGAMCPQCNHSLKDRKDAALAIEWREVIPHHRALDFLYREEGYCNDAQYDFQSYHGKDVTKKEKLRIELLEKRAEFLQIYLNALASEEHSNAY